MSDFRFACPQCGQRIACDSSCCGRETVCPSCQATLTVPLILPKPNAVSAGNSSRKSAATTQRASICTFAVVSLVSSCFLSLGCIPGIIFGHLAKARMRRDPSLLGQGLANCGLFISYFVLACSTVFLGYKLYERTLQKTLVLKDADVMAAMASRGVDRVEIGDPTSEAEHGIQFTHNEAGIFFGRPWRAVSGGGQFSYVMKVLPNQAMNLDCRYWGSDMGGRVFDILVEQRVIATQTLDRNVPERFFNVEYKIPQRITRGKTQVTVEFRAHPGLAAGGVFSCQILKR